MEFGEEGEVEVVESLHRQKEVVSPTMLQRPFSVYVNNLKRPVYQR